MSDWTETVDVMDGAPSGSAGTAREVPDPPGPGERGYTLEPSRPRAYQEVQPPSASRPPDGGSYLTPAEQTFVSRLPAGQPVTPEQAELLTSIRRRVEGHRGRVPRHPLTVQSDLLLLDSVLANAPTTPRERDHERVDLENELREIEAALAAPSHGDRIAEERARGAVISAVREITSEEDERYRQALATVPINLQTGRVSAVRQQEVMREHQAELRRIEESRPRIERQILDEEIQKQTEQWQARRAALSGRKGAVVKRLRELAP